ncbi:MAG TPA: polysaccharide deacetylase [Stellaceae bacterium]|nr:polysaccharide deacetylase [Stellaceae bacterium]
MATQYVCLTFDFDAVSGFIARGFTTPTPISRGEFGVVASERILALLRKYNISSTWFIPGHTIETFTDACRRVFEAGHEIAHHGWTHVPPASLSREQEDWNLARGNEAIRMLTGEAARGYRSPSWDLSPHTIGLLLNHGFLYESSLMGHDYLPYRCRTGDEIELERPAKFGPETELVEMPISWSTDDHPHFEYMRMPTMLAPGLKSAEGVLQNWYDDFDYMTRIADWGVLTYTCHPYVIGRGHRMLMLERLIEKLLARGAVFRTMESVAKEWLKTAPPPRT